MLSAHPWPGNVRELGHAVEAALIVGGESCFDDALASALAGHAHRPVASPSPAAVVDRYSFYGTGDEERDRVRSALAQRRGNRTLAARDLCMSRNTLRQRMKRFGL